MAYGALRLAGCEEVRVCLIFPKFRINHIDIIFNVFYKEGREDTDVVLNKNNTTSNLKSLTFVC